MTTAEEEKQEWEKHFEGDKPITIRVAWHIDWDRWRIWPWNWSKIKDKEDL
ncbi:MAG: hypothetical protein WC373_08485 [Smithella sp.]|jgi:hypothetical protein